MFLILYFYIFFDKNYNLFFFVDVDAYNIYISFESTRIFM